MGGSSRIDDPVAPDDDLFVEWIGLPDAWVLDKPATVTIRFTDGGVPVAGAAVRWSIYQEDDVLPGSVTDADGLAAVTVLRSVETEFRLRVEIQRGEDERPKADFCPPRSARHPGVFTFSSHEPAQLTLHVPAHSMPKDVVFSAQVSPRAPGLDIYWSIDSVAMPQTETDASGVTRMARTFPIGADDASHLVAAACELGGSGSREVAFALTIKVYDSIAFESSEPAEDTVLLVLPGSERVQAFSATLTPHVAGIPVEWRRGDDAWHTVETDDSGKAAWTDTFTADEANPFHVITARCGDGEEVTFGVQVLTHFEFSQHTPEATQIELPVNPGDAELPFDFGVTIAPAVAGVPVGWTLDGNPLTDGTTSPVGEHGIRQRYGVIGDPTVHDIVAHIGTVSASDAIAWNIRLVYLKFVHLEPPEGDVIISAVAGQVVRRTFVTTLEPRQEDLAVTWQVDGQPAGTSRTNADGVATWDHDFRAENKNRTYEVTASCGRGPGATASYGVDVLTEYHFVDQSMTPPDTEVWTLPGDAVAKAFSVTLNIEKADVPVTWTVGESVSAESFTSAEGVATWNHDFMAHDENTTYDIVASCGDGDGASTLFSLTLMSEYTIAGTDPADRKIVELALPTQGVFAPTLKVVVNPVAANVKVNWQIAGGVAGQTTTDASGVAEWKPSLPVASEDTTYIVSASCGIAPSATVQFTVDVISTYAILAHTPEELVEEVTCVPGTELTRVYSVTLHPRRIGVPVQWKTGDAAAQERQTDASGVAAWTGTFRAPAGTTTYLTDIQVVDGKKDHVRYSLTLNAAYSIIGHEPKELVLDVHSLPGESVVTKTFGVTLSPAVQGVPVNWWVDKALVKTTTTDTHGTAAWNGSFAVGTERKTYAVTAAVDGADDEKIDFSLTILSTWVIKAHVPASTQLRLPSSGGKPASQAFSVTVDPPQAGVSVQWRLDGVDRGVTKTAANGVATFTQAFAPSGSVKRYAFSSTVIDGARSEVAYTVEVVPAYTIIGRVPAASSIALNGFPGWPDAQQVFAVTLDQKVAGVDVSWRVDNGSSVTVPTNAMGVSTWTHAFPFGAVNRTFAVTAEVATFNQPQAKTSVQTVSQYTLDRVYPAKDRQFDVPAWGVPVSVAFNAYFKPAVAGIPVVWSVDEGAPETTLTTADGMATFTHMYELNKDKVYVVDVAISGATMVTCTVRGVLKQ